jgi:sigma-B regulation protein RsbU (phosphoserine phosphatase)
MSRTIDSRYALLAGILLATVLYQAAAISDAFKAVFLPERFVNSPFLLSNQRPEVLVVTDAKAAQAGIKPGDEVLAIGSSPLVGSAVLGRSLRSAKPGDAITATVRTPGSGPRQVTIPLSPRFSHEPTLGRMLFFVINIFLPIFSILLGFYVVGVRPRDARAWLLLLLLLSFTQFFGGMPVERWVPGLREFGMSYNILFNDAWPVAILLFGIHFPESITQPRWRRFFHWVQWLLLPVLIAFALLDLAHVASLDSYAAVRPLQPVFAAFNPISTIAFESSLVLFFFALLLKSKLATSHDMKRRLLLVYLGTFLALAPILIMVAISVITGKAIERSYPGWLFLGALGFLFLFPITLAYAVVVHRAIDVRVVIRQSIQYALAKNGVRVLQVAATAVLVIGAVTFILDAKRNRPQKITTISVGIALVMLTRRGTDRLRRRIDRRFFREAYNAEQILVDLSERVGTIEAPDALFRIVAERISLSLHVSRMAVLTGGPDAFVPIYLYGYAGPLPLRVAADAVFVRQMEKEQRPVRVYLDDPNSWINRSALVSQEERDQLVQLQTELLLPLEGRGRLLGFISLGRKLSEEPYSNLDIRLLQSVARQTGLAMENLRLASEIAREISERDKLNREMEIAKEVQERLFPQSIIPVSGLEYSGECLPALGVGGDYYDFFELPGKKLGLAIGDVSGKGISAALMMASLQAALRGQALVLRDQLACVIGNVNRLLHETSSANRYATLFYAEYDPTGQQLSYVNAGHNAPILVRPGPRGFECLRLESGGAVVGLFPELNYEQATISLSPGDLLVAYTDGISEAMNVAGEEWGEDALIQCITKLYGLPAVELLHQLLAEVRLFAQGAPQHDDMTLLVTRIQPPSEN